MIHDPDISGFQHVYLRFLGTKMVYAFTAPDYDRLIDLLNLVWLLNQPVN